VVSQLREPGVGLVRHVVPGVADTASTAHPGLQVLSEKPELHLLTAEYQPVGVGQHLDVLGRDVGDTRSGLLT